MKQLESERIASAEEVLQGLTAIARNQVKEQVVVTVGTGNGCSTEKIIEKDMSARDRTNAWIALAKRYGLQTDKLAIAGEMVVFNGEDNLED
jgi:phage terminase small subunit